jgi:hypothetical protein
MATADMGGAVAYDRILESLEQDVAVKQKKAELAFHDFCKRERLTVSSDLSTDLPSAEWRSEIGDEPAWLGEHGRTADLLVVGRAPRRRVGDHGCTRACVMTTGRPVLIAPVRAPDCLSGTVAIAWKSRPEAARAVAAAQPLVEMADRVVILSVDEDGDTDEPSCERLRSALSWHNPRTILQRLKQDARPPVETVLAAASAAKADVL